MGHCGKRILDWMDPCSDPEWLFLHSCDHRRNEWVHVFSGRRGSFFDQCQSLGNASLRLDRTHFFPFLIPLLSLGSSLLFHIQGMLAKVPTDFPEAEKAPLGTTQRLLDGWTMQEGGGGPSSLGKD